MEYIGADLDRGQFTLADRPAPFGAGHPPPQLGSKLSGK